MANITGGFDTSATPNASAFLVSVVTVTTSGTPVNVASQVIPNGFSVAIRAYRGNGSKVLYVATSSVNTADATKRVELKSGETVSLMVDNANLVWLDASGNGTKAEVLTEI